MFGKQEELSSQARSQSLIQEGVTVKGDIRAEGDIRLEGVVEGSVVTKARVIIGSTGKIRANIDAAEVVVMGRLNGKIVGNRRIELRKGAHVEGDIATQSLVIEEGVFFQGLAQMNVPGTTDKARTAPKDGEGGRPQPGSGPSSFEKKLYPVQTPQKTSN